VIGSSGNVARRPGIWTAWTGSPLGPTRNMVGWRRPVIDRFAGVLSADRCTLVHREAGAVGNNRSQGRRTIEACAALGREIVLAHALLFAASTHSRPTQKETPMDTVQQSVESRAVARRSCSPP